MGFGFARFFHEGAANLLPRLVRVQTMCGSVAVQPAAACSFWCLLVRRPDWYLLAPRIG